MIELKIDPEFRDKIPPLTDAEFEQLRENILADGEVYEPLVVWNGTIVDGHNRWKVIQEHPEIPYRVKKMEFSDKWAAFDWMYKKQLGRRNLTDEQKTYLLGKLYEARKRCVGNHAARGQNGKYLSAQNEHKGKTDRTAEVIAAEVGVGKETVKRAEKFSKGVDALKEVSEEAVEKIMSGNSGAAKSEVSGILNMTEDEKKQFAEDVVSGEIKNKPNKPNASIKRNEGRSQERRESYDVIDKAFASLTNDSAKSKFTVDDLAEEIKVNGADFTCYLRRILSQRSKMLNADGARDLIRTTIDEITKEIEKVRSLL